MASVFLEGLETKSRPARPLVVGGLGIGSDTRVSTDPCAFSPSAASEDDGSHAVDLILRSDDSAGSEHYVVGY